MPHATPRSRERLVRTTIVASQVSPAKTPTEAAYSWNCSPSAAWSASRTAPSRSANHRSSGSRADCSAVLFLADRERRNNTGRGVRNQPSAKSPGACGGVVPAWPKIVISDGSHTRRMSRRSQTPTPIVTTGTSPRSAQLFGAPIRVLLLVRTPELPRPAEKLCLMSLEIPSHFPCPNGDESRLSRTWHVPPGRWPGGTEFGGDETQFLAAAFFRRARYMAAPPPPRAATAAATRPPRAAPVTGRVRSLDAVFTGASASSAGFSASLRGASVSSVPVSSVTWVRSSHSAPPEPRTATALPQTSTSASTGTLTSLPLRILSPEPPASPLSWRISWLPESSDASCSASTTVVQEAPAGSPRTATVLPQRSRAASTGMVMVLSLARLSPSPDWLVSASAPDDSWRASMNFWHAASASPTAVMVLPQTSR